MPPWDRLSIKMPSYQYRDSHNKDSWRSHDRLFFEIEVPVHEPRGPSQYKDVVLPV